MNNKSLRLINSEFFKINLDNNIDGDVIKYFSNEHLSLMIKDVGGQIKFGLMMKHLKANESKVCEFLYLPKTRFVKFVLF